jgi:hypothetical protein
MKDNQKHKFLSTKSSSWEQTTKPTQVSSQNNVK